MSVGTGEQGPRNRRQFSLLALFGLITVVAILCAPVAFVIQHVKWQAAERVRQDNQDRITVVEIVNEVEAIRAQLNRAPKNQAELEALLGHSMPFVHDGGHKTPIHYHYMGENRFYLQYELWATDDWIYDSDNPNAGWVQHWY